MMNLFQYDQSFLDKQQQSRRVRDQLSFLENRQEFKIKAVAKRGHRLRDFVEYQNSKHIPDLIQDQYMNRSQPKNLQIQNNKMNIINRSNFTGRTTKSRSLKQGPENIKRNDNKSIDKKRRLPDSQRIIVTQQDRKYLSYSMPSKERNISQSAMNFNEKANKILRNYQKDKQRFHRALQISSNRYRLAQVTHFDQPKITHFKPTQTKMKDQYKHSQSVIQDESKLPQKEMYFSQIGQMRRRDKTYFKLAKTAQLFAISRDDRSQLDALMSRSHYNRVKKEQMDSTRANSFLNSKGRFSVDMSMIMK